MSSMIVRYQQKNVAEALETRRVVLLLGARQSGKTTLAKTLVSPERAYKTLDDFESRQIALLDPSGFVAHAGKTLIIDEIQHAPDLLLAIKQVVDADTRPGQYLLTGSSHIFSLPTVRESLAGRLRKIRIRPLSQGEIQGRPVSEFLLKAFGNNFRGGQESPYTRENYITFATTGGFPEPLRLLPKDRQLWHRDYLDLLLDRDLREISHIQRRDVMKELVHIVAAWSSKMMDVSMIGSGLSIQRATLTSYLNALEILYLVESIPAWTRTEYARVGRKPKLFMTDPGLMAALLGGSFDQIVNDADRSGKLMETFAFHELSVLIDLAGGDYTLYHYRDREHHEIDFVVERFDKALVGIEIKAGTSLGRDDFKHLRWFKHHIAKDQPFTGIVLYTGKLAFQYESDLWAIPFSELWGRAVSPP
jgi:predicted AAA+ superfamily ATPase